jgi:multimeric flavodoxin WrbA
MLEGNMKILGVSGSSRPDDVSATFKLVNIVLENTGIPYDVISLKGKKIAGCVSCLGCVSDNICKVQDDFSKIREKIMAADAFVIGAPNFYSGINAATHAFLERWYQFRHQGNDTLWGKLAVSVGVGGMHGKHVVESIDQFLGFHFIESVAAVTGQGAATCYSCGYGENCSVGAPYMIYGEGVKIVPDMIPSISKQPQVLKAAAAAGKLLGDRLRAGNDKKQTAKKMQDRLMALLASST